MVVSCCPLLVLQVSTALTLKQTRSNILHHKGTQTHTNKNTTHPHTHTPTPTHACSSITCWDTIHFILNSSPTKYFHNHNRRYTQRRQNVSDRHKLFFLFSAKSKINNPQQCFGGIAVVVPANNTHNSSQRYIKLHYYYIFENVGFDYKFFFFFF